MNLLSRPRRPRRANKWNAGAAVTFIVTLAAGRSVALAARAAGMSRKSAYALRGRDPAFAAAWNAARSWPAVTKWRNWTNPRNHPVRVTDPGGREHRQCGPVGPDGGFVTPCSATSCSLNLPREQRAEQVVCGWVILLGDTFHHFSGPR